MTITAALWAAFVAFPAMASDPFEGLPPLLESELAGASGRSGLDVDAANQALLRDNRVGDHSVTGSNRIQGSLNGNAGITTVFQNTGNNTVLQSATSVTVNMR
jgi:hypothetical protein